MINDSDTQAKRISLWQELLVEMPAEHRKHIEEHPEGQMFHMYCGVIASRLSEWQRKRNYESN